MGDAVRGSPPEPEAVEAVFDGSLIHLAVERWPGGIQREVVRHPGACAAVVFVGDDRILLVRQMREAVRRVLLEVPAGTRDVPAESGEATIRREIEEETGFRATTVDLMGSILTTPGFTDERIDLYLARAGPEPVGRPEEEGVEVVEMPFAEAVRKAVAGEIEDAKTVVALLLARERRSRPWSRNEPNRPTEEI